MDIHLERTAAQRTSLEMNLFGWTAIREGGDALSRSHYVRTYALCVRWRPALASMSREMPQELSGRECS